MAFNFGAAGAFTRTGGAPVSTVPLTMSAWFTYENTTLMTPILTLSDYDEVDIHAMAVNFVANSAQAASYGVPNGWKYGSVTSLSAGTRYHGCAIFSATDHRRMVVDGDWAGSGVDGTSKAPTGIDTVTVGAGWWNSARQNPLPGEVGEAGIWNVALDQSETEALAAGASPLLIRPSALVFYWPGVSSGLIDVMGGPLTVDGTTPTVVTHPRIINPSAQIIPFPPAAAPAGGNEPLFYHHQRMLSRCS